jgi:hypothetical protein
VATQLDVTVGARGTFVFTANSADGTVSLVSPIRGAFRYRLDRDSMQWVDIKDGHFLFDLLTRDLVYTCHGYPKF